MTRALRQAAVLAGALAAISVGAHASAAVNDPARGALRGADVFVSPRLALTPDAAVKLAASAANLADEERPVKFALVTGPVGAPTMLAYARRLRRELHYGGTVVVVAPSRRVGVAGPGDPAVLTQALRTAAVGTIPDPVARAIAAANAAAPTPPSGTGPRTRGLLGLLGLALVGGLWAVAIGVRRTHALERRRLSEARAAVAERLNTLERQIDDVAARSDLDSAGRDAVEAARRDCVAARASLAQALSLEAIQDVVPMLETAHLLAAATSSDAASLA